MSKRPVLGFVHPPDAKMFTSFSAFIPTSHSSQDLPPLSDDEELWEMFIKLVLEHRAKLTEILADTLNTSLLFESSFTIHDSPII